MDIKKSAPMIITRKSAREQIEKALFNLEDLQTVLGKKKFKRRIKQAGRLFSDGLPKSLVEKKPKQNLKKVAETAA